MSERTRPCRSTESKYKGGARELYVTYDVRQYTGPGETALYARVKRVYIAGDVGDWKVGDFTKRSGRHSHGVKIDYKQSRRGYRRRPFVASRDGRPYDVDAASVRPTEQRFSLVVDVPKDAQNVRLQIGQLPEPYAGALQRVR
jgi:hypothetical protein